MIIYGQELRKTPSYRVWIDEKNVAHIRLVKRINFKTLIGLCRESYLAIDKETEHPSRNKNHDGQPEEHSLSRYDRRFPDV